jgi:hypothetical protein
MVLYRLHQYETRLNPRFRFSGKALDLVGGLG